MLKRSTDPTQIIQFYFFLQVNLTLIVWLQSISCFLPFTENERAVLNFANVIKGLIYISSPCQSAKGR